MKDIKKIKEPWADRHKIVALLVNRNDIKTGVELGVAFGGNSENILQNTNIKKLYGVDAYKNRWTYNDGMNRDQEELNSIYKKTLKRLSKFGDKYKHIRKFSKNATNDVPDNLDFVYVDADHSYIGCLNDLRLWVSKVREGGIIAGDDYNSATFPGTTKAVNKYFKKIDWEIQTEGPRVWWVRKKHIDLKKISFLNKLFLFNSVIRKIHFLLGETYNAILGKLFFNLKRQNIGHKIRVFLKKILPQPIIDSLKENYGK